MDTLSWLWWPLGALGSYLLAWLVAFLLASGVSEGDPVIKAFHAWSMAVFLHIITPVLFVASWLTTWLGVIQFGGIWGTPPLSVAGVVLASLLIDTVVLLLITRDRNAFHLITPRE